MPADTSFTETGISPRVPIWVIPIIGVMGLLSSLFAMRFWFVFSSHVHNQYLFAVLASSVLGLAVVAVLWSLRQVQNWGRAIAIVAATVSAHSLEQFLDPYLLQDEIPCWDCSPTANFASAVAIRFFLVASITYCATLAATVRRPGFLRLLLVAVGSSTISAATIGFAVPAGQRHHLDLVFNGLPLEIVWQLVLAFYLGVAVWADDVRPRSSSAGRGYGVQGLRSANRFAAFFVLAAYVLAVGIWGTLVETRMDNAWQRGAEGTSAAIAQSNKEAPAMVALSQTEPLPLDQVLIMDSIEGWKPYLSGPERKVGWSTPTGVAAAPSHILYSATYAQPNGDSHVDVEISQYPNSDWARYELRNTPTPNELFRQSKQIHLVNEFGSKVYEEAMYRYWSSGDKLVFWIAQGYCPQTLRKF
jgi:hypothetical protein